MRATLVVGLALCSTLRCLVSRRLRCLFFLLLATVLFVVAEEVQHLRGEHVVVYVDVAVGRERVLNVVDALDVMSGKEIATA